MDRHSLREPATHRRFECLHRAEVWRCGGSEESATAFGSMMSTSTPNRSRRFVTNP
jgi:hypothetical protein